LDSSRFTRSASASGRSILLTATMIGTFRGASVIDRFLRLWHHPVVGGDHENDDVGRLSPARPHRREGFVARGVEET